MLVGDWDGDHLYGREPGRERAGVVLDEHAEEPLDRAEQRTVDHDRALARAVRCLVLEVEPRGQLEVDLDRRHLPGPPECIPGLHGDLRSVERRTSRVGDQFEAGLLRGLAQRLGRVGPVLLGADELLLRVVAGGQLQVEVRQAVVREQAEREREEAPQLAVHLRTGAVDVRVVHGQAAHAGEAVHDA